MIIESIQSTGFAENTWIIANNEDKRALIIDPGVSLNKIENRLDEYNLNPCKIISTHLHPDHLISAKALEQKFDLEMFAHRADKKIYDMFDQIKQRLNLNNLQKPKITRWISDNNPIQECNLNIEILHTPGHSPGSICLLINGKHLFSGDTLFSGSIGRTDLPFGSREKMRESLNKIRNLPINTKIYPGHGDETSLDKELNNNPYLI